MSDRSKIEWTDATWNPMRGCEHASPGCVNCYAERHAARFCGPHQPWEGFVDTATGKWTRKVALVPEKLLEPLSWQRPRRIFVNAMSDTFHESIKDEDIDKVLAVMLLGLHRGHTFQVLTKRAERMASYFADGKTAGRIVASAAALAEAHGLDPIVCGEWVSGEDPLPPHIWLGVSVESQEWAERRIPHLLTIRARRFLSCEPLLGRVNLRRIVVEGEEQAMDVLTGVWWKPDTADRKGERVDWVIVGGESGGGARSMRLEWAREIVVQCRRRGVPVFMKQMGSRPTTGYYDDEARHFVEEECSSDWPMPKGWREGDGQPGDGKGGRPDDVVDFAVSKKGGDPSEWPESLRVREFPS